MAKKKAKKGFTLIELMLSIAFLASLAVMIAVLVSNAASTYRRGITLKRVNSVGTEIIEDLRATINNNHVGDLQTFCNDLYSNLAQKDACEDDGGFSFASIKGYKNVTIKGDNEYLEEGVPVYGLFCTGKYSYLWNSGYFFDEDLYTVGPATRPAQPLTITYGDSDINDFRLIKVLDERRAVCQYAVNSISISQSGHEGYIGADDIEDIPTVFNLNTIGVQGEPMELISGDNATGMALYDLTIARPARGRMSQITFYSGSFILGSVQGGVHITSPGDYCKAYVDDGVSDQDYCAVNRFNFAVQTSGL